MSQVLMWSTNWDRAHDELSTGDHVEFEYPFGYPTGLDFKKEDKASDRDLEIISRGKAV